MAMLIAMAPQFTSCKEDAKLEERMEQRSDDMENSADVIEDNSVDLEDASDYVGEGVEDIEEAMENFGRALDEIEDPEERKRIRMKINEILDSKDLKEQ